MKTKILKPNNQTYIFLLLYYLWSWKMFQATYLLAKSKSRPSPLANIRTVSYVTYSLKNVTSARAIISAEDFALINSQITRLLEDNKRADIWSIDIIHSSVGRFSEVLKSGSSVAFLQKSVNVNWFSFHGWIGNQFLWKPCL